MTLDAPNFAMDGGSTVSSALELTPKASPASLAPPICLAPIATVPNSSTPPTPEEEPVDPTTLSADTHFGKEMLVEPAVSVPEPTTPSPTTESLPATPTTTSFKRTASGTIKGPGSSNSSHSSPGYDEEADEAEKRRAVDPTRIAELSTNLRTRLTYALLKLQNGWEKHSLDQVEELASQVGSPMSTVGRNSAISSPTRTVRGLGLRRGSEGGLQYDDEVRNSAAMDIPVRGTTTYESFWRKHPPARSLSRSFPEQSSSFPQTETTQQNPSYNPIYPYPHQQNALAPPAPIFSRRPSNSFAPPLLRRDTSTQSTASAASGFSTISTGSYGSAISSFSVTGDDELEREAVRGLMWLASPGNRSNATAKRGAADEEGRSWKRREREVQSVGGGRWR